MKKLFLAMFAVIAITACESTPTHTDDYEDISGYGLDFDNKGYCFSRKYKGLTKAEFSEQVCGYGWEELSSNIILENGAVSDRSYYTYGGVIGAKPIHFYFNEEGVLKLFREEYCLNVTAPRNLGYERDYTYKDNCLYIANTGYRILQVTEHHMVTLVTQYEPWSEHPGIFTINIYQRMSPEELTKFQESYIYDPSKDEATTKYQFSFDSEGVCYSQNYNDIDEEAFASEIKRYVWQCIDLHRILDNGNVAYDNYWEEYYPCIDLYSYYLLIEEKTITQYIGASNYPQPHQYGYIKNNYFFENSALLFNEDAVVMDLIDGCLYDNPSITKPNQMWRILEVNDNKMMCIEYMGEYGNPRKKIYGFATYIRVGEKLPWTVLDKYTTDYTQL